MALTTTNALVSISVAGGPPQPQANAATLQVASNSLLVFSLQSTALIQEWILAFQDLDNPLLNSSQTWNPGQANAISYQLGPQARRLAYVITVSDGSSSIATAGGLVSVQGGITVNPAALTGQAPVWNGSGYSAQGHRPVINGLSYGIDNTGNPANDSTAGWRAAVAAAQAAQVPIYMPAGTGPSYIADLIVLSSFVEIRMDNPPPPATPAIQILTDNHTGLYWGGAWAGEAFACLPPPASVQKPMSGAYQHENNFWWVQAGGLASSGIVPQLFLTECPFANLNGASAFSFEAVVNFSNPLGTPEYFPYCGGSKSTHDAVTTAFYIHWTTSGGGFDANVLITGTGGTATVATTGGQFAYATDYFIVVTYDGTNLKLIYGAPGSSSPTTVSAAAAKGNISMRPWEDFMLGGSASPGLWPCTMGNGTSAMRYGNVRISKIARTYSTLPSTEWTTASCDSNTNLILSFQPAFTTSSAYPPTLVVAGCGHPADFGAIITANANIPLFFRNVIAPNNSGPGPGCIFRGVAIQSAGGCIIAENAPAVRLWDCQLQGTKGITLINNSYYNEQHNSSVAPAIQANNSCQCWGVGCIGASGIGVTDNVNCRTSNGIPFLFAGSGSVMLHCKTNTISGQCFVYINGGTSGCDFYLFNCASGDEGGVTGDAVAMFNNVLQCTWIGGGAFNQNGAATTCCVRIDGGTSYRFDCDFGVSNLATSIIKATSAPTNPIQLESTYQGQLIGTPTPWSDGTAAVQVRTLELSGRTSWNATGSGGITCMWGPVSPATGPDFTNRTIVITDTGSLLTGTTAVTAPTVASGYRRRIANFTNAPGGGHSVTFGGATGATVTIAAGKTAEVESNGSGWERVTPDT